jgi:protocatechuate 3,4-dioxygenase beta subunit
MANVIRPGRRAFFGTLGAAACSSAFFTTRGLYAEALTKTLATTEGPFYPDKMPLDTDNDLVVINDSVTPAIGEIAWVSGRLLTETGQPIRNAVIEIWQCDANESYIHTQGRAKQADANFQGYGRYLTDSTGRYFFRTIKPISYTLTGLFRAPHIHYAVSQNGKRVFTTQVGVVNHPDNPRDPLFKAMKPDVLRTILADYTPLPGSRIGELQATIDLVVNKTAFEGDDGKLRGGIGKSTWEGMPGLSGRKR